MLNGRAFGAEIVETVKAYVSRVLMPLEVRLGVLEGREPPKGEKGDPGEDGINGQDGINGVDGFGFDDLDMSYDGERTFALRFMQGDRCKAFHFRVPVLIYRGAWRAGDYERGDTVTYGGSLWHCNVTTAEKPDEGVEAWTRAVRRGRDGKNGDKGDKGEPGVQGRAGRDLTQMAPDGSKW
jgi:integrin beta 3